MTTPDPTVPTPQDPLHGMTLQAILEELVAQRGFPWLAEHVRIRCFTSEPSIGSSLAFLRRTPWARAKVERLYVKEQRRRKRNARRKWRAAAKKAHDAAASEGASPEGTGPDESAESR